jgi:hypothetical protein
MRSEMTELQPIQAAAVMEALKQFGKELRKNKKRTIQKRYLIVEIKQASGAKYWYRKRVGDVFLVEPIRNGFIVMCRKNEFLHRVIQADDCVKIGEALVPEIVS